MKKLLIFLYTFSLVGGGLIYMLFRSENLIMFNWFTSASLDQPINKIRETTTPMAKNLPNWVLYSLPDGLWIFSYITLISLLWGKISFQNIFWMSIIPLTVLFHELGQGLNLVPGTFDITDLVFYTLGTILSFIIYFKFLKITK